MHGNNGEILKVEIYKAKIKAKSLLKEGPFIILKKGGSEENDVSITGRNGRRVEETVSIYENMFVCGRNF